MNFPRILQRIVESILKKVFKENLQDILLGIMKKEIIKN